MEGVHDSTELGVVGGGDWGIRGFLLMREGGTPMVGVGEIRGVFIEISGSYPWGVTCIA